MRTWRNGQVLAAAVAALLAGCGSTEDVPEDDYAAAIPDGQMLALTVDGDDASSQGLDGEGGPSGFKQVAEDVIGGINQLVGDTQDGLREIAMNEPAAEGKGQHGEHCRIWQFDHEGNTWQLLSCERDRRNKEFAFVLRGRPVESDSDGDYLNVFAGYGRVHPRFDGKRRGAGVIAYDFDNLRTLTGGDARGKLVIGYRAVGRARQLVIGMDKVYFEPDQTEPFSALFRFTHVVGKGGRFVFWTGADVLTRDEEGNLDEGQDGTNELVRAAIAWNRQGEARTAYTACGGTVGLGCVSAVQCWSRSGAATYGEVAVDSEPHWDETACPGVPFDVVAPDEGVEEPGDGLEPPEPIDGE